MSGFLHLDVVLSLPRPGLAIICREAFIEGVSKFLDGWDLIDVSVQDTALWPVMVWCWMKEHTSVQLNTSKWLKR